MKSPLRRLFGIYSPLLHGIILVLSGLIIYSNTLAVPFAFDDIQNIVDNRLIRNLRLFLDPSILFTNRPFGLLTFALNYWQHDLALPGYHIVNVTIHILNSLLVYALVVSLLKTPYFTLKRSEDNIPSIQATACAIAVLFLCHPVQTGAVTYIVQRFTLLATFFYLVTLVTYLAARGHFVTSVRWQSAKPIAFYTISLLSTLLAMKSKEIAFTLPIMVAVIELMFFETRLKTRICLLLPFLATMAIIPLSMLLMTTSSGDLLQQLATETNPTKSISRIEYLLNQPRVVMTYIRLLLLPIGQNVDYDYPVYRSFLQLPIILSLSFHLVSIACAVVLLKFSRNGRRMLRLVSFGIIWFYITLSVESSLIPLDDIIFEHRMYLPSIGFFLIPMVCIREIKNRYFNDQPAGITMTLFAITAFILAGAAFQRNAVWRSGESIWQDAVNKSPMKSRPHYNLGFYLGRRGELDLAINEFKTAIALDPYNGKARNNLGTMYSKKGDVRGAIQEFRAAVQIEPNNATAHFNLGYSLALSGDIRGAIEALQNGLQIEPNNSVAHHKLRELTAATSRK